jgi:drug/metabolite transporter (DMT)-like permease
VGWWVLRETVHPVALVGGALVIAGVAPATPEVTAN